METNVKPKIIAVDFDGCLVENKFPEIGNIIEKNVKKLREERENGAKIILWTSRCGIFLDNAIYFCQQNDIPFDYVNEGLPDTISRFGGDPRKVYATEYWDDRAINMSIKDIGEFSDGYHTFNELYDQRLILSVTLFTTYRNLAWKSKNHSDGLPCFGGEYFIVGINTPAGPYTYHYKLENWNLFNVRELEKAPEWDGHTAKDVSRLFSLNLIEQDYCWVPIEDGPPEASDYDWVLVQTDLMPEGFRSVPHVAELRNGIWYSDCCEGPMEEALGVKVTHWFDMQKIRFSDAKKEEEYDILGIDKFIDKDLASTLPRRTLQDIANELKDNFTKLKESLLGHSEESPRYKWAENEIALAFSDEVNDDFDYDLSCAESALKAFKSLIEDGHSGFSIGITQHILNRLIEGKPLSLIEDVEESWNDVTDIVCDGQRKSLWTKGPDILNVYQCKRYSSLFKYIYANGKVKYQDNQRFGCVDLGAYPEVVVYHFGVVSKIMDTLYPVTMPYSPGNAYRVYCEDFTTNEKLGDLDTLGIFYVIEPNGKKTRINKFFKEETPDDSEVSVWTQIRKGEYLRRKFKSRKNACSNVIQNL